jgi:hypothetical protein
MSLDSSMGSAERFADSWIIDSCASKHMNGMWGAFMSINEIDLGCNVMTNITREFIVVFLHMKYDRYIITMMSVPYIENIW